MKTAILAIPLLLALTAAFIVINNIPQLPRELCKYLWYAYIPCAALLLAFIRGRTAKGSGGGILFAAGVLVPLLCLSVKHALPFASTFTAWPVLLAAIPCALWGEILGKIKKRKSKASA